MNSNRFASLMQQFSDLSIDTYDNYAFEAGYLQSLALRMFDQLSPDDREQFEAQLTRSVVELQQFRGRSHIQMIDTQTN